MKTQIFKVNASADVATAAARGAEVLLADGLVAFPTETVYGLAARATSEAAMERLREIKDRPESPFTVHIGCLKQALALVPHPAAAGRRMMKKAWPGPVTIVLPVAGATELAKRLSYEGTIGLRLPDDEIARQMLAAVDDPVVAPSANLAGQAPPTTAAEVIAALDGQIDLVIDGGATRVGLSSTIVRFDDDGAFEILREGTVSARELELMTERQILFVCTGNTCRSPMAEGIARTELARKLRCLPGELADRGWRVLSAGTMAFAGSPATQEAIDAAVGWGADISGHRNQPVTEQLIRSSDLILCMTDGHMRQIREICPDAADRVGKLDDSENIPDPIGGSDVLYRQTAQHIQRALCDQMDTMMDL